MNQGPVGFGDGFEIMACPHPLVESSFRERTVRKADGTTAPMDTYIPRDEGDLLYSIVRRVRPLQVVEIGMANGLSTLFLASGLEDNGHGRLYSIDPYQSTDWGGAALDLIRRAGLTDRVELIEKPSHQAIPELERADFRAQFIFVDGSHLFDYVMVDFLNADRILDVGGHMAFDDSDWAAVNQVIRFALLNRHYKVAVPGLVIEPPPYRPSLAAKALRAAGQSLPALGAKLRPEFRLTDRELQIEGRCVVLEKTGHDDRDSQVPFHVSF